MLEGDDPDQETLAAKIHFLEERLNDKKEMLLEKDLILEEVTALSDKLRKQAQDGRADTLDLAQKVNLLRSRIQMVTRRMMGLCSECSMYQASAIKCQEDYRNLRQEVRIFFDISIFQNIFFYNLFRLKIKNFDGINIVN